MSQFQQKMILAIVNFLEYIFLIIGLSKCLCTIVKPKIQHGLYSLCILLPLSILLPAFFSKVDAKEVDLDDWSALELKVTNRLHTFPINSLHF